MYIINTIPHGKCFVRYFRPRCLRIRNLTRSPRALVRFLIQKQLGRKYRTPALSVKYPLFPTLLTLSNVRKPNWSWNTSSGAKTKEIWSLLVYVIHEREIRHFHVVVVQKWRRNQAQKSVIHVQSYCFAYRLNLYIALLTLSLWSCRLIFKFLMFSSKQEEVTPFDVLTWTRMLDGKENGCLQGFLSLSSVASGLEKPPLAG